MAHTKPLYESDFLKGKTVRSSRITVDGYKREWIELIFDDNSVLRIMHPIPSNPLYVHLDSKVWEDVSAENLVCFSVNH